MGHGILRNGPVYLWDFSVSDLLLSCVFAASLSSLPFSVAFWPLLAPELVSAVFKRPAALGTGPCYSEFVLVSEEGARPRLVCPPAQVQSGWGWGTGAL